MRSPAKPPRCLEGQIVQLLGEPLGGRLCALLKATSPSIYKDQLRGAKSVLAAHQPISLGLIAVVCDKPRLTATALRDYLAAYTAHPERLTAPNAEACAPQSHPTSPAGASPLARYAGIGAANCGAVAHDLH